MPITEGKPATQTGISEVITLRDIFEVLFRQRYVVLVVLLLSITIGIYFATRPRSYSAEGEIRIESGTSNEYRTTSAVVTLGGGKDPIDSDVLVMQSRTLYLQVARELDLANAPALWGTSHMKHQTLDDPRVRDKVYRLMEDKIHVRHNPKDEIVTISCETTSPELSAKIVNTLINGYIVYLFQMRYGSTHRASGWVIDQLTDLKDKINMQQARLIDLQKRLGVIDIDRNNDYYLLASSLDSISKAASSATVDRIAAEAKLRFLEDSNPNLIEGEVNLMSTGQSSPNGLLQNLRNSRAQAASAYASLLAQFGPNYPAVKQEKAQLDELQKEVDTEEQRILNQAKIAYNAASSNEKMTKAALQRKQDEAFESGGDMGRYILLLSDYESNRSLYEDLIQHLSEADITSGLEAGDIDIVSIADIPVFPDLPGPVLIMIGSVVAGLLVGVLVALAIGALDQRVTGPDQIERISHLPILAQIPHFKRPERNINRLEIPAVLAVSIKGPSAEAIQTLRTSILLAKPGSPPKVILITSSTPKEGKSTVSIFLAATLARNRARVLLCDCDLHRGSIARRLGISNVKGLASVLTRQQSLDSSIQEIAGVEGLFVLPTGPYPPDPGVLAGSEEMRHMLDTCRDRFDFVIIDSPPILGVSDALNLGQHVDSVLLLVRERVSKWRAVLRSVTLMTAVRLPIIGAVINDIGSHTPGYGYGYGYGYAYGDYYGESSKDAE